MKKLDIPITHTMTNGDKIRAMSDEELAVFLCRMFLCCDCIGEELCTLGWWQGKRT